MRRFSEFVIPQTVWEWVFLLALVGLAVIGQWAVMP